MALPTGKERARVVAERQVADQSARELAPLLTVDQRALVSILATAKLYQLDVKMLIQSYAEETGSNAAKEFAAQLTHDANPLDVAAGINDLMPQPCRVALNSSRASGTLDAFYRSWLAQTVDDRTTWVRHEDTNVAALGRLGARVFICVWLLTFILLYVVPEHMKMQEEFGMPRNSIMTLFLWASDLLAKLFPLFLLCVLCFGLYVICFRRSLLSNYIRRWFPGRWRQIVLPKPILNRKLLAWDLLAFRGKDSAKDGATTDWNALVKSNAVGANEANILNSASSMETQAWLLRNMAEQKNERRKSKFSLTVHSFSFLFQLMLAAIIILAAFTVFSMMTELMRGLT